MSKQGTLLIVDDNRNILTAVQMLLDNTFKNIFTITNPNLIPATFREHTPDVVLLDMNFTSGINSGNEGLFWLQQIKSIRPETQVVLFTAYADIELAVKGIKDNSFVAVLVLEVALHHGELIKIGEQGQVLSVHEKSPFCGF